MKLGVGLGSSFIRRVIETGSPVLSSVTITPTGETTLDSSVNTNEGDGTLYWVVTQSQNKPTPTQIKNGQNDSGVLADDSGSQVVNSSGVKNVSSSGLVVDTTYYIHYLHEDVDSNQSGVASSSSVVTPDETAPELPVDDTLSTSSVTESGFLIDLNKVVDDNVSLLSNILYKVYIDNSSPVDTSDSPHSQGTDVSTLPVSGRSVGETVYYIVTAEDEAGNVAEYQENSQVIPDLTAPTLSNPSSTNVGSTTADGSVDTNEDNGTLYWVVTNSSTTPSKSQIKSGNDHNGSTAEDGGNQTVSVTGTQNVSASTLNTDTLYYFHFMHEDSNGNQSIAVSSVLFRTSDLSEINYTTDFQLEQITL